MKTPQQWCIESAYWVIGATVLVLGHDLGIAATPLAHLLYASLWWLMIVCALLAAFGAVMSYIFGRHQRRIDDDALATRIANDCHDAAHDPRWCATCEAREAGIQEYREALLKR